MNKAVILDTGPLVAFLNHQDSHHDWAVSQFKGLKSPFITCESVLSEAGFLLARTATGSEPVWIMIQRQFLSVPFFLEENTEPIQQLLQTYRNVPMSLADACLVRMTELYPQAVVLTLDSDFQIYRKNRIEPIACIAPWVMPG